MLVLLQAQGVQMMCVCSYSEVKVMTRGIVLAFCCYQESPAAPAALEVLGLEGMTLG